MLTATWIACLPVLLPLSVGGEGIERAVLDYAESYYEARPEYIERSVHPELAKLGHRSRDGGEYEAASMGYEDLHGMIVSIRDGEWKPEPGPKEIEILDQMDQTALVKLTAAWGTDYMQLARFDGVWQTRHVMWQTAPRPFADEAARAAEVAGVEAAVTDYLEALYAVEPDRIERSVDPQLVKYGFWRKQSSDPYQGSGMTFEALRELAGTWNAKDKLPADAPRTIEVLDVMDRTACAKLTASWGVDTFLLHKLDGVWRIRHVMWQSHPPKAER